MKIINLFTKSLHYFSNYLQMPQQIHSVFRDELFNGRVALVTGGGSGIGFRTALELSYLGCTVVISARKKDRLDEAARIINNFLSTTTSKGKVLSIPMNVRSEESRNECITKILEITGKIDYLVRLFMSLQWND